MGDNKKKAQPRTVRDRLWLWGHPAGCHTRRPGQWGLPGGSSISPEAAAAYLGIPNLLLVRYEGEPRPPFAEHARPLAGLDRVVWSVEGLDPAELDAVLEIRAMLPNLTGVLLDDYFSRLTSFPAPAVRTREGEDEHTFSLEGLRGIRRRLDTTGPRLDIWVVLYAHELGRGPLLRPHLELCDVVTFWTWQAADLLNLEQNFNYFEELVGPKRRVLGLYLWDYGARQPMPREAMEHQCLLGLQWMREGRLDGLIFLASCICDLGLEAVEWARRWVADHGGVRVGTDRPR